jgi:nicotinate-nucleotide adenylyltransferase
MKRAIGIFGGRFDPVHYGHLRAADEVRTALSLAEVRLVPARDPPHRGPPGASAPDRLAMLELALQEFPKLSVDARELRRPGKSYTVDTLTELRREDPLRPLALIVGVDTFAELPDWHRWRELFDFAHVVVVTRPGAPLAEALTGELAKEWDKRHASTPQPLESAIAGAILAVPVSPQPISATEIRAALARGRSGLRDVRGLLPRAVLTYIDQHQLYAQPSDAS